jgi:hypothetical protein
VTVYCLFRGYGDGDGYPHAELLSVHASSEAARESAPLPPIYLTLAAFNNTYPDLRPAVYIVEPFEVLPEETP